MSQSDHARLAPSAAHRWGPGGCPAAPSMAQKYPEREESEAAREGTAAHWVLSEMVEGRMVPAGNTAPNGVPVDQDMVESAGDFIRALPLRRALRSEEKVTIHCVHQDCAGTPDIYWIDPDQQIVAVYDYKYGHRYVDVFQCLQLLLYAMGVLECEGVEDWTGWTVQLHIYQPQCYHPEGTYRTWSLSGDDLYIWQSRLMAAAIAASAEEPGYQTGPHCRDCPGLLHCDAALRSGGSAIEVAYRSTPIDLTPLQIGVMLHWGKQAEERLKVINAALEEQALHLARSGTDVPLWKADYSSGTEKWTVPPEQVFAFGDMFGVDLRKPSAPITPAQARKAGLEKSLVATMADKPRGSMKLVPVTEKYIARAFDRGAIING